MTNIIVKNRNEIQNGFHPGGDAILISITDPDGVHPTANEDYIDVLRLKFHDADYQYTSGVNAITPDDSLAIYLFTTCTYDGIPTIVVNCDAGMSRSAGCAAALAKILNGNDNDIIKQKPNYNRKVYREVINVHFN